MAPRAGLAVLSQVQGLVDQRDAVLLLDLLNNVGQAVLKVALRVLALRKGAKITRRRRGRGESGRVSVSERCPCAAERRHNECAHDC